MTTFNNNLTIEDATKLFNFKGQTMFSNTEHNRKIMLLVISNHLKSLKEKTATI